MADYTPTTGDVRSGDAREEKAWESLRAELGHWLAAHDAELRAEVERLRARIGAAQRLLSIFERDGDSNPYDDLRTLLAGSGEQPGEGRGPVRDGWCCWTCADLAAAAGPAPMVPDSAGLRERVRDVFVNAERRESFGGTDIDALTDAVLAVVGQGVTDCNCGFGGQHDPANPRCRANRATVRPSGKEGL